MGESLGKESGQGPRETTKSMEKWPRQEPRGKRARKIDQDKGRMAPRAENAKINVTDEPYFGTYILCNYLPFSKADKGAQGGPQQHETPKHSPTDISKRLRS